MTFTVDQLWWSFWIMFGLGYSWRAYYISRIGSLQRRLKIEADARDRLARRVGMLESENAVLKGIAAFTQRTRHFSTRPAPAKTPEQIAAEFIAAHAVGDWQPSDVLRDLDGAYRAAARRCHPDAGGNDEDFKRLQKAKRILDGAR